MKAEGRSLLKVGMTIQIQKEDGNTGTQMNAIVGLTALSNCHPDFEEVYLRCNNSTAWVCNRIMEEIDPSLRSG